MKYLRWFLAQLKKKGSPAIIRFGDGSEIKMKYHLKKNIENLQALKEWLQ